VAFAIDVAPTAIAKQPKTLRRESTSSVPKRRVRVASEARSGLRMKCAKLSTLIRLLTGLLFPSGLKNEVTFDAIRRRIYIICI
jgi:hypothetical protein